MRFIGIDLGTTNSVVCEYRNGEPHPVRIEGRTTVPSVVYIEGGAVQVGSTAKGKALIHPERALTATKRVIGSSWSKEIEGEDYTPIDSARHVLSYLKAQVEADGNGPVSDVVVTVPAYFDEAQRRDTKLAAESAGLNVLRLLPEPTAAAIAYGFDRERDQLILVFDLGGGTFDVSILEIQSNAFTVRAVDGNHKLGGEDFDDAIVAFLRNWIQSSSGKPAGTDSVTAQTLKEAAERAKIELSAKQSTDIIVPSLGVDIDRITRGEYVQLIQPHLDEMLQKTSDVMTQAGLGADDLNRVVLVGGSSKTPAIAEMLAQRIKQPYMADDMDVAVAKGAAVVCASLSAPTDDLRPEVEAGDRPVDLTFLDVIPQTLGVDFQDKKTREVFFVPILRRNTHYPTKGAALGVALPWQPKVKMGIFRGEAINPDENMKLGELTLEISRRNLGDEVVPVCGIFDLDENGILTLTQAEMPLTSDTRDDLTALFQVAEENENLIPWESVRQLIESHGFDTGSVKVKAV